MIFSAAAFAVVAVSTAVVAPTTSEAIPAFARQTGAACLSCHFQSFPTLAPMGRSFKEGAFTDMGDQALVEDDGLSIPASLNITVMVRPQFISTNDVGVKTKAISATADQVMMIAGRIGTNTGAFLEMDTQGGGYGNNQLLHSIDVGDNKVILSYFTGGFGEDFGLQLMSVWGQHGGLLGGKALTINGSMASAMTTTGVSVAVANDMGAVSLGLINNGAARGATWRLAPVARVQSFFEVGDMELGLGAIFVSGKIGTAPAIAAVAATPAAVGVAAVAATPAVLAIKQEAKRFGVDVQIQGEAGDMLYGLYADFASASASSATLTNIYNTSLTNNRTGFSVRATIKPIENIILMAGIGEDKTGAAKIKKATVGVEYELYQNAVINLTYDTSKVTAGTTKTTMLDFEFLM